MVRRGASPKGGSRDNHRVRWPKTMSYAQQDAWYAKIEKIRQSSLDPGPKRIYLPAARVIVAVEEVL
jgi:hypothetical protein